MCHATKILKNILTQIFTTFYLLDLLVIYKIHIPFKVIVILNYFRNK